jgi:uncharacterized protein (DUF2147 family)
MKRWIEQVRLAGLGIALVLTLGTSSGTRLALAQDADAIAGRWLVEKRDAVVLVEPQGDEFVGRIVWAKDRDGIPGDERLDTKNPSPDLRSRKVLGSTILSGVPTTPQDGWYGKGRIYNPKTGKSYPVKIRPEGADRLKVRVGGGLLHQTTRWTRAPEDPPGGASLP